MIYKSLIVLATLKISTAACDKTEEECTWPQGALDSTSLIQREKVTLSHRSLSSFSRERRESDAENLHIVFSTGCNAYQHWQAEVLLNSAKHVNQNGKITRLVADCDASQGIQAQEKYAAHPEGDANRVLAIDDLHKSTYPNLQVYLAPALSEAKDFPWYNKPWSFYSWLQNNTQPTDGAIAIIDPDEFFLQPLRQRGGVKWTDAKNSQDFPETNFLLPGYDYPDAGNDKLDVAQPGMAVAQKYGLRDTTIRNFDQKTMCPGGTESPCASVSTEDVNMYYSGGPPYILHKDDFKKVVPLWFQLMKPIYEQRKGDILDDMWAYNFASMHNNVKHRLFKQFMVANPASYSEDEGWDWIDNLESMSCDNPQFPAGHPSPGFLHACNHYKACTGGEPLQTLNGQEQCVTSEMWNFHKGHVPTQILDCNHPLLMTPPDDLFNAQVRANNKMGKRHAWMLCNVHFLVNRAAEEYKQKFCSPAFNQKKCTRIVDVNAAALPDSSNPWKYPLATISTSCCPECEGLAKRHT